MTANVRLAATVTAIIVFLFVTSENQHIIEVDEQALEILQGVVHQLLERLGGVAETHCHPLELESAPHRLD